jgi:hypothetical protein
MKSFVPRLALGFLVFAALPAAAQDLTGEASRRAASPQSAWSATLVAPQMTNELTNSFAGLTGAQATPRCPPGQVPKAAEPPVPAQTQVGAVLTPPDPAEACMPAPEVTADAEGPPRQAVPPAAPFRAPNRDTRTTVKRP